MLGIKTTGKILVGRIENSFCKTCRTFDQPSQYASSGIFVDRNWSANFPDAVELTDLTLSTERENANRRYSYASRHRSSDCLHFALAWRSK